MPKKVSSRSFAVGNAGGGTPKEALASSSPSLVKHIKIKRRKEDGGDEVDGEIQSVESVVVSVRDTFDCLNQLWENVQMDMPTRDGRVKQACQFITKLLQDIRSSEEQMVRDVIADLEVRREAVFGLRAVLGLPSFDESFYPPNSIALLKVLDLEKNRLEAKRGEIIEKQLILKEKYVGLCNRVGTTVRHIEGVNDKILSENKLNGEVDALQSLVNKRLNKALQLQSESKRICETIQLSTNSHFDEDLHFLSVDLLSQSIILSLEFIKKMENVNQKLKSQHDAWAEQIAFRYNELLVKLNELGTKCFRPSVCAEYPSKPDLKLIGEKELQKMEEEVCSRQRVYERAKPIFDKLDEWMASWKQKLDTERRVCRASFYKNRAGSLNTKLKERKLVEQRVPKLLAELRELCDNYVKNFQVYDIFVEEMRADNYAETVMQSYQQDREVQRAQKLPAKPLTPGRPAPSSSASRRNVFATTNSVGRTAIRALNPHGSKLKSHQTTPSRRDGVTKRTTRKRMQ